MRFLRSVFAVTLLAGAGLCVRADAPTDELKQLDGHWFVVHRAYDPATTEPKVTEPLLQLGIEVEIASGKLTACDPGKKDYYFTATFNPASRPKSVDLKGPGADGPTLPGIYALEEGDNLLTLAFADGKVRPRTFRFSRDHVLVILRRKPNPR